MYKLSLWVLALSAYFRAHAGHASNLMNLCDLLGVMTDGWMKSSLERTLAGHRGSVWVLWLWGVHVEAEKRNITRLKHGLLFLAAHCPFTVGARLATLFLVNDVKQVIAEYVVSIASASRLLVYSCWVAPFSLHLHSVCELLLALGYEPFLVLLDLELPYGLVRRDLRWVIHAYLVHSIVGLVTVEAVYLAENQSAKSRIAHSITSFMLSKRSLQVSIDGDMARECQSELTHIVIT